MPEMQSYTKTVRDQVSPEANRRLAEAFDDFAEKVKNPDSPEKKLLDTMIAIIACAMLLEQITNEANALLHYLEEVNRKADDPTAKIKPLEFDGEKGKEFESMDIDKILSNITSELSSIQQRRAILEEEFEKNMKAIEEEENESLNELIEAYIADPSFFEREIDFFEEEPAQQISGLYMERESHKAERHQKLEEMIAANSADGPLDKLKTVASMAKKFTKSLMSSDENGCDAHMLSAFPKDLKELEQYKRSYIVVKDEAGRAEVRYVTQDGLYEDKTSLIKDPEKFAQDMAKVNPKGRDKIHLSEEQVNQVITGNGGHVPEEKVKTSEERAEETDIQRREAQQRLAKGYKQEKETVDQKYDSGTQLQLMALLQRKLGSKYPPSVLSKLAAKIDQKENGYVLLKKGLKENHDKTIKELDTKAEKLQDQKQSLGEKRDRVNAVQKTSPTSQPAVPQKELSLEKEEEKEEQTGMSLTSK